MYWNNPTIEITYPSDLDPIKTSFHQGQHCLFYDPAVDREQIRYQQRLTDICRWANELIDSLGVAGFIDNPGHHYDIANLIKLNMWVDDIRRQGIVKPTLLFYDGEEKYGINNGESRLRALERIDSIRTLRSFITTSEKYADKFNHLERIESFNHFAEKCPAVDGQLFLFTLTDPAAPYGIFWYEYNSERTRLVTPGESTCVETLRNYLNQTPKFEFTPEWFDNLINWQDYGLSL